MSNHSSISTGKSTDTELLQLSCGKPSYYRQPYSSVSCFLDEFEDLVTSLAILPGRLLVLGDFNVHLDDPLSPGVNRMTNILTSTGLVQHVTGPTHRSSHSLDSVISRKEDAILTYPTVVLPNTFSDHHTITFSIEGHLAHPSTSGEARIPSWGPGYLPSRPPRGTNGTW